MTSTPREDMRLLDLFCCAGGAAMGYHRAGFDVTGVDIVEQPNYPFAFVHKDVLSLTIDYIQQFDLIHASPPCQGYSTQTADPSKHDRGIEPIRDLLHAAGVPYVIENVEGARPYLREPVRLCGSSFGLDLRRHRYFETNWSLPSKPCAHFWQTPRFRSLDISMVRTGRLASVVGVHGHLNYPGEFELRCKAMGIDWMTNDELVEAIPPAFTEYIGRSFLTDSSPKELATQAAFELTA